MRPSTQVVTLRFRRAPNPRSASTAPEDAALQRTPIEGTLDWPEEQASAEIGGCVFVSPKTAGDAAPDAVLTLEGTVGEVLQGAPERVGWLAGATVRGTFCKDGTDGTVKGSWSAKALATALEPLGLGGMRINVGLLPDRLLAAEGAGPGVARGDGLVYGPGNDPVMGSSCR